MKVPGKYYLWIIIGVLILIPIEYYKPKEVDWRRTFSSYDNIAFGSKVLYELIPEIFPGKSVKRINKSFYDYYLQDRSKYSLIFIANHMKFSELSLENLIKHIGEGNEMFVAAKGFDKLFLDTLGLEMESYKLGNKYRELEFNGKKAVIDTISKLSNLNYQVGFKILNNNYEKIILGATGKNNNFVKISIGDGAIYLHSEPLVFTNYYLLKGYSVDYCEEILKQMKLRNIIWSDYPNNGLRKSESILRYILESDSLRYGYYVLLILLILYLSFAGRRKQRVIPVISPLVNSSVDYIRTISNLYLGNKNHKNIAQHRIRYFKNYFKTHYFIDWSQGDDDIALKIGSKVGKGEERIIELLQFIKELEKADTIGQNDLIKLNKELDFFISK